MPSKTTQPNKRTSTLAVIPEFMFFMPLRKKFRPLFDRESQSNGPKSFKILRVLKIYNF